MSSGITAYDVITLVVAITGLGLALLSLGWQAASFALSGSRVRATIKRGAVGGGNLVTVPPEAWSSSQVAMLASQGFTTEVLAVETRNVGRLPVNVESVALKFANGVAFNPPPGVGGNPPLQHRLEPGSSQTWFADANVARAVLRASQLSESRVHFLVGLGNGKLVRTKRASFS